MPQTIDTYCPNCSEETAHTHEHGPQSGLDYCRTTCTACGAEVEAESDSAAPAHSANESVRWSQA